MEPEVRMKLRHLVRCFGAPALRPREFVGMLDEMLNEIKSANVPVVREPEGVPA